MFLFVVALTSYLSKKIGYSLLETYFFCQAFLLVHQPVFAAVAFCARLRYNLVRKKVRYLQVKEAFALAQIQVLPNESLDSALKRFKKELQNAGILKEYKEHEHYTKPSDKRRKQEAARRRKQRSK